MKVGSGITVFERIDPKAVSVVMFIIAFCSIFTILLSIALLFEKGHRKILLILSLIFAVLFLAGSVFCLLWLS
ncbi:MAG: hypothetical protein IJT34_06975 [Butyrivibrio sp.]|nr:hypothetical protein [Butyrivibrio sp.]